MSKHFNKYFLREKEYISLLREKNFIYNFRRTKISYRYMTMTDSRLVEIDSILKNRLISYSYSSGYYKSSYMKKKINRIIRLKNKKELNNFLIYDKDSLYDKYSCRYWY